jgi:heat shock protein HtpX
MGSRASFLFRAWVAIALLLGFYALALGLTALLLYVPYAELVYAHRLHIKLAIGCVIGAFAIAKGSIFVRSPPFEPPGPEITEQDQPQLFALIRDVAHSMKTPMPKHVYLIPDVNAFVTEVGGFMGFGSRRVMGIGLGILAIETVSELKAVIAHEFGHYVGGDTRLGGVVYRTRLAIGRVLETLGSSWLSKPFELYGKLFMRVSHGVSREQELAADRASVAVAGLEPHVNGLTREARGGVLFESFARSEALPLFDAGYRPRRLYAAFRTFIDSLDEKGKLAELDRALAESPTDPYDTHPALKDRIEYARALPDPGIRPDDRVAWELLADADTFEGAVSRTIAGNAGISKRLEPVEWDSVASIVYAPRFAEDARRTATKVCRAYGTPDGISHALRRVLAELSCSDAQAVALLLEPDLAQIDNAEQQRIAPQIVGQTLSALFMGFLLEHGGELSSKIAEPHRVTLAGEVVEPFSLCRDAVEDAAERVKLAEIVEPFERARTQTTVEVS